MSDQIYERLLASASVSDHVAYFLERSFGQKKYENAGSPIEELFAAALNAASTMSSYGAHVSIDQDACQMKALADKAYKPASRYQCTVIPQARILDYRVDFLICIHAPTAYRGIVVECDGHDFHERTKEQVARDKSRDREIQKDGFRVFRFSGSEIWKNAIDRAAEVIDEIDNAIVDAMCADYQCSISVAA